MIYIAKLWITKGVPSDHRAKFWLFHTKAQAIPGYYSFLTFLEMRDLRSGYNPDSHPILLFIKQIEDDLYRTFPQHPCFQPNLNDEYRQMFAGLNLSSREGRRPSIHDIDIPISPCLGQSYFSSREENVYLLSLRRILVAFAYYSWPQPENSTYTVESQCSYKIGYCQGLNCVVGLILLAFTSQNGEIKRQFESADTQTINSIEADVFWTFVGLVENILPPEMYGFNLQGARLQQYIMWEVLIKARGDKCGLEKLQKWFKTLNSGKRMSGNGSLAAITMPWFLSLFVNILPMETVFCLLDNLVYHGEKILFRAALAVLFLNEEQICNCYDAGDAGFYLKAFVLYLDCSQS